MKDVLDAVAMHKADIHDICEQMKVATPSGVESLSGRLRAAVVMLENELGSLFGKTKPVFMGTDGKPTLVDPGNGSPVIGVTVPDTKPDPNTPQPGQPVLIVNSEQSKPGAPLYVDGDAAPEAAPVPNPT